MGQDVTGQALAHQSDSVSKILPGVMTGPSPSAPVSHSFSSPCLGSQASLCPQVTQLGEPQYSVGSKYTCLARAAEGM